MNQVKRIEIVIDAAHTPQLVRALKKAGATGYTLVRDVHGYGDRGDRTGDELANVYRNCYLIVAADAALEQPIVDAVRPLLERHGGVCLVSDARWVKH
ncbi:MAG: P-II family nitrogen regulator [Phycisphaeraceae bacterium]